MSMSTKPMVTRPTEALVFYGLGSEDAPIEAGLPRHVSMAVPALGTAFGADVAPYLCVSNRKDFLDELAGARTDVGMDRSLVREIDRVEAWLDGHQAPVVGFHLEPVSARDPVELAPGDRTHRNDVIALLCITAAILTIVIYLSAIL